MSSGLPRVDEAWGELREFEFDSERGMGRAHRTTGFVPRQAQSVTVQGKSPAELEDGQASGRAPTIRPSLV
ncbi:MAG: hypothetical protein QXT16_08920 [Candidatus Caldarchaeum sp.]